MLGRISRPLKTMRESRAWCRLYILTVPRRDTLDLDRVMTEQNTDMQALALLERFSSQLRWTVQSVVQTLDLPNEYYGIVRNRAEAWLMTYASLDKSPSDGYGRLDAWIEHTQGDENQIKHLVAMQLRRDLTKHYLRVMKRNGNEQEYVSSFEVLVNTSNEPTDDNWESRTIINMGSRADNETRLMRKYPLLSANVLEGTTQAELANHMEVGHATIERRIAGEKRNFLADFLKHNGLHIEGNETLEELQEAYINVKKAQSR